MTFGRGRVGPIGGLLRLGRSWRCRVLRVVMTIKSRDVDDRLLLDPALSTKQEDVQFHSPDSRGRVFVVLTSLSHEQILPRSCRDLNLGVAYSRE
jgi:hypothetical protein